MPYSFPTIESWGQKPTITKRRCRQWIADLRSGKFKQGLGGYLFDAMTDEYCCLGVLGKRMRAFKMDDSGSDLQRSYVHEVPLNGPPIRVLGSFSPPESTYTINVEVVLAEANDKGRTFKEIADWVEQNILPQCRN